MTRPLQLRLPGHRPRRSHLPKFKFSLRMMMAVLLHLAVLIAGWLIAAREGIPEAKAQLAAQDVHAEVRVLVPFVVWASYYDHDQLNGVDARVRAYFLVLPWETRLIGYGIDGPAEPEQPWGYREVAIAERE